MSRHAAATRVVRGYVGAAFWAAALLPLLGVLAPVGGGLGAALDASAQGSLSLQLQVGGMGLIGGVAAFLSRSGAPTARSRVGTAVVAYALLAVSSLAWTTEPALSLRRIAALVLTLVFSYGAARVTRRIGGPRTVALGLLASGAAFAASALAVEPMALLGALDPAVRLGRVGIENQLSWILACGVLGGVALLLTFRKHGVPIVALSAVCASTLLLTKSRTSIGAVFAAGLVMLALSPRVRGRVGMTLAALGGAIGLVGAGSDVWMLALRGGAGVDVVSLSGRLVLWRALWPIAAERPLLGAGFGAFWTPEMMWRASAALALVASGHSMYLDEFAGMGVVGLLTMTCLLLFSGISAVKNMKDSPTSCTLLLGLTVFVGVVGITESIWQRPYLFPVLPLLVLALYVDGGARSAGSPSEFPILTLEGES